MGSACSIKRVSNQVAPTILELKINECNVHSPKIVFLGIDGSGKSTIIKWLKRSELGETNHDNFYNPIPKPASHSSNILNVNTTVNLTNCLNKILLIDVPGNEVHRKHLWKSLVQKPGVIMIVYVIDQCDVLRYSVARQELMKLMDFLNAYSIQCSLSIVINNKYKNETRSTITVARTSDNGGEILDENMMIVSKAELKQLVYDVNKIAGNSSKRVITMSIINNAKDIQSLAVNLYPTMQEKINID